MKEQQHPGRANALARVQDEMGLFLPRGDAQMIAVGRVQGSGPLARPADGDNQ
jgi:hypothetical protein